MIDLQKQPGQAEPTEEEIQQFVNSVYNYAIDLYNTGRLSLFDIKYKLIDQGIPADMAENVIDYISVFEEAEKNKSAIKKIIAGAIIILAGAIIGLVNKDFSLFWGIAVFGGITLVKGICLKNT